MINTLIQQFIAEDCDDNSRRELLDTIHSTDNIGHDVIREFSFNRFNLRLFFADKTVVIEDDLDVGSEGEQRLGMDEFEQLLL